MKLLAGAGCGVLHFPAALFPIEGFRGIHDPPTVRVLALECGQRAALVSVELVMLPPELVEAVKDIVSAHTGTEKDHIWVHTTHAISTPHAPHALVGTGGHSVELSGEAFQALAVKQRLYTQALTDAVTQAARSAAASFGPARLGVGTGRSHLCVNRDVPTPFGWWIGRNPAGRTDPRFDLLRFDTDAGAPAALVIIGGLKPTTIDNAQMAQGKRLVSADIPGLACRLMEEALGAPVLYFMGAAGDQVPREQALLEEVLPDGTVRLHDYGVAAGLEMVERLGRQMASDLLPSLRAISCGLEKAPVRVGSTAITWPGRKRTAVRPRRTAEDVPGPEVQIQGQVLALGDVALAGLRPEVNCVTAQQLAQKSPFPRTALISMVDGGQKYMPDAQSYALVTWEAQNAMMMPGAAEAWVDAVCALLEELRQCPPTEAAIQRKGAADENH